MTQTKPPWHRWFRLARMHQREADELRRERSELLTVLGELMEIVGTDDAEELVDWVKQLVAQTDLDLYEALAECRAKLSAFSREWAECREDRENALNALDRCRKVAWGLFTWAADGGSSNEPVDGLRELMVQETQNGKMD